MEFISRLASLISLFIFMLMPFFQPDLFAQRAERTSLNALTNAELEELSTYINNWLTQEQNSSSGSYNFNPHENMLEAHGDVVGWAAGIHCTNHFFPWHRIHIRMLENYLMTQPNGSKYVPLPYWRPKTGSTEHPIPPLFSGFDAAGNPFPGFINPLFAANHVWVDNPAPNLPGIGFELDPDYTLILGGGMPINMKSDNQYFCGVQPVNPPKDHTDIGGFSEDVEVGYHNNVHPRTGGAMAPVTWSPTTLIFWPWHAWVDELWYQWEWKCHGNYTLFPANPENPITHISSATAEWTGLQFVKGQFIIDNGAKLTIKANSVIHFGDSDYNRYKTSLTVEPGGELIIEDGAMLTGIEILGQQGAAQPPEPITIGVQYHTAWDGITVIGTNNAPNSTPGKITMNGATLEHARIGIYSKNGGVVEATNCDFLNNRRDVYFARPSVKFLVDNPSMFNDCNFFNDKPLRDIVWISTPAINPQEEEIEHHLSHSVSHSSEVHIFISGQSGIWLNDCHINNDYFDPHDYKSIGIDISRSQVIINDLTVERQITGVRVYNLYWPGTAVVSIAGISLFNENFVGVQLNSANGTLIQNATFNLPEPGFFSVIGNPLGIVTSQLLTLIAKPVGIFGQESFGCKVIANIFNGYDYGYGTIFSGISGKPDAPPITFIKSNIYNNLPVDLQVQKHPQNLKFSCNTFNSFDNAVAITFAGMDFQGTCQQYQPGNPFVGPAGNVWDNLGCTGTFNQVWSPVSAFKYAAHTNLQPTCITSTVNVQDCIFDSDDQPCPPFLIELEDDEPTVLTEISGIKNQKNGNGNPNSEAWKLLNLQEKYLAFAKLSDLADEGNLNAVQSFIEQVNLIDNLMPYEYVAVLMDNNKTGSLNAAIHSAIQALPETESQTYFELIQDVWEDGRDLHELTENELLAVDEIMSDETTYASGFAKSLMAIYYGKPIEWPIDEIEGGFNPLMKNDRKTVQSAPLPHPVSLKVKPGIFETGPLEIEYQTADLAENCFLEITDLLGKVIARFPVKSTKEMATFHVSDWNCPGTGIYQCRLLADRRVISSTKFVCSHN